MRAALIVGAVIIAACKKDPPPEVTAVDAAPIDAAPPPPKVAPTPGALVKLPDSPLTHVLALGERRILLAKTNVEIVERSKDGQFNAWQGNGTQAGVRAILSVPIAGGEPEVVAQTNFLHHCSDARDVAWAETDAGDVAVLFLLSIDGDKPRTLVRLPAKTRIGSIGCRADALLGVLSDTTRKEHRVVLIDKSDGTMRTLASGPSDEGRVGWSDPTADDANVYWLENRAQLRTVLQVPLRGGAVTTRFKLPDQGDHIATEIHGLRATAKGMYWLESGVNGAWLSRAAPGKKDAQSIGKDAVMQLDGTYYSSKGAIWRLSDDGASLVKVADGAPAFGFAARGNRAVWFVHARPPDLTLPGEIHLVQRTLVDETPRDR